jgi:hypothetical protein
LSLEPQVFRRYLYPIESSVKGLLISAGTIKETDFPFAPVKLQTISA